MEPDLRGRYSCLLLLATGLLNGLRMKPRHAAALAALVGLVVPLLCELAIRRNPDVPGVWLLLVWPSSIVTMAQLFHSSRSSFAIVLIESIAINAIIYAGIGWLVASVSSRRQ